MLIILVENSNGKNVNDSLHEINYSLLIIMYVQENSSYYKDKYIPSILFLILKYRQINIFCYTCMIIRNFFNYNY